MSDTPTLVPEYEFEWDDYPTRTTDEIDITAAIRDEEYDMTMEDIHIALEHLSILGRADESCTVTLLGYGN